MEGGSEGVREVGGREGGRGGMDGREGGIAEGREWREGRDDCYTYSNIIQWHHSI